MMRSGELKVAIFNASVAFSASSTAKPLSSKPALRKRLIFGSSSIRRTTFAGLLIWKCGRFKGGWPERGQGDRHCRSQSLSATMNSDCTIIGLDEGRCDPEAEA